MKIQRIITIYHLLTEETITFTEEKPFIAYAQDIWDQTDLEQWGGKCYTRPIDYSEALEFITIVGEDIKITFETNKYKEPEDFYYPNIDITITNVKGFVTKSGFVKPEEINATPILLAFWEYIDANQMILTMRDGDTITYDKQQKPTKIPGTPRSKPKPKD